jgi:hypothetical protein
VEHFCNSRRGWGQGRGGGRRGFPLLIESYMDHISSGMFPTPRKRIREHTWRKLKIMYKEMGLALYRDLYRSLTIRISKDCFNVKKRCGLYLDFSNGLRKRV